MMENIKKEKYKVYGAIVGFLAVIAIGFAFAIFPIIRGIVRDSDEIEKKKIDNEINQQGIGKITEMEKMHNIFDQKRSSLEVLLGGGSEVAFFKEIESLAVETGNKIELKIIDDKKVASKKDGSILGSLPHDKYILMNLTLWGNYENLVKFLGKLEKKEKYVNVIGVDISKLEISEEASNVFSSGSSNKPTVEPLKKEVLQSLINLVVYIKK